MKQTYYVEPEPLGRRAYALFREVLAEKDLVAICKVVIKDREALSSLGSRGPVLVLETLHWPDEIRLFGELDLPDEGTEVKPAERAMAAQLLEPMVGAFDPSDFRDEYRTAVEEMIASKLEGREVVAPEEPEVGGAQLADLMAMLEASVRAATAGAPAKPARAKPTRVPAASSAAAAAKATSVRGEAAKGATAKDGERAEGTHAEDGRAGGRGAEGHAPPLRVSTGGAPPRDREPSGQLPLGLEPGPGRLAHRVRPMLPTEGEGPFDDPAYLFEPWWPGVRAFVSVEDGRVHVRAEALDDPAPRFPELAAFPLLVRADGIVVDATLMVLDADGRPSTRLLDARLAPGVGEAEADRGGRSSRVADPGGSAPVSGDGVASRLAGTAAIVVSDLVFRDGEDLATLPFRDRRASLEELLEPSAWCMPARGFVGEGIRVASVLGPLGFSAMSARRLDARLRRGRAGDAWFRVPLVAAPRALPPILAVVRKLPL